jgi:glycosyltransferase involved in cell wall biosynthesis
MKALVHLGHRHDLLLVIIASNRRNVSRIRRYIASRGLASRVVIHDRLPHRAMASLYKQAYACVAPLARGPRNELQGCCPLKIVESMASGTPVIASDLPVVREIIDDGVNGILTVPDSPRSLAHAIERLMDDPSMRATLASGAHKKAGRLFTAHLYSERLGALYASLLGGNGNAVFDR